MVKQTTEDIENGVRIYGIGDREIFERLCNGEHGRFSDDLDNLNVHNSTCSKHVEFGACSKTTLQPLVFDMRTL